MSDSAKIKVVSHVDEALDAMHEAIERALATVGLQMERNAKIEINKSVYDTPLRKMQRTLSRDLSTVLLAKPGQSADIRFPPTTSG